MSDYQVIPQSSIDELKAAPEMAGAFDRVWGEGASERVLGSTQLDPMAKTLDEVVPERRDTTVLGKFWNNTVGAVAYGAQEAFNETVDSFESFDSWFGTHMDNMGIPSYLGSYTDEEGNSQFGLRFRKDIIEAGEDFALFGKGDVADDGFEINAIDQPDTIAGNLIGGVAQFATGFGAINRATKLSGIYGAFTNGAIVDALMFDPNDTNVTGFIETLGVDTGAFGELMATDPDDPEWANRLRNAAEGAIAGGVVEMIAYGVRAKKLAASGRAQEAADAAASAARFSKEVEKEFVKAAEEVKIDFEETQRVGQTLDEIELATPEQIAKEAEAAPPLRDPDQSNMDLGEAVPEKVTFSPNVRILTPEELELARYNNVLAKSASREVLKEGQAIVSAARTRTWDKQLPMLASLRESQKIKWQQTPGSEVERWGTTKLKAGKAIREISALTGEDFNKVVERFNSGFESKADMAAELVARSEVVKRLMDETQAMSDAIAKQEFNPKRWPGYKDFDHLKAEYQYKMSYANALARENKAAVSSVGRALNATKIAMKQDAQLKRVLADPMFDGNIEAMAKAQQAALAEGKPVFKAVEEMMGKVRKYMDAVNTFRVNALLSGPGTQEVNFISNLLNTVAIPTQELIGGAATLNARQMRHAIMTLRGQVASAPDAVQAALRTWWKSEPELDVMQKVELDAKDANMGGTIGSVVTLPTRVLMSMDEFFKQSAYRGRVLADADMQAKQMGLKGAEKAEYIQGYLARQFDPETGQGINGEAMLQAQRSTFTEVLEKGSFGESVQKMATKYPLMRFVVPFVRTPINILSTAYQHVPVAGALSKRLQDDLAAGGARRAQALGKQAIGLALITWTLAEVSKGHITGAGPSDPRLRKVWMKNNQPYSIRIPQEDGSVRYVSYARYEPMAQLVAIAADYAEIMDDEYGENAGRGPEGVVFAILMATAENSINKTFTQGIHDFMKLLADPDPQSREQALNKMVASFVPNAANQLNGDMAYREARTLMDAIRARGPNYDRVDVKRNVLGEPVLRTLSKVDPLAVLSKDIREQDPVMAEITRLALVNQTVAGNPNRKIPAPKEPGGRLDLSTIPYKEGQSLYDAWLERTGTIEIGGKTLRQALAAEIGKARYKKLWDGAEGATQGTKAEVVGRLIRAYRQAARADIPELVSVIEKAKRGEAQMHREARGIGSNQLFDVKTIEEIERDLFDFN